MPFGTVLGAFACKQPQANAMHVGQEAWRPQCSVTQGEPILTQQARKVKQ